MPTTMGSAVSISYVHSSPRRAHMVHGWPPEQRTRLCRQIVHAFVVYTHARCLNQVMNQQQRSKMRHVRRWRTRGSSGLVDIGLNGAFLGWKPGG